MGYTNIYLKGELIAKAKNVKLKEYRTPKRKKPIFNIKVSGKTVTANINVSSQAKVNRYVKMLNLHYHGNKVTVTTK